MVPFSPLIAGSEPKFQVLYFTGTISKSAYFLVASGT